MKSSTKSTVNGHVASLVLAVLFVVGISILTLSWIKLQKEKNQNDTNALTKNDQIRLTPTLTPTPILLKRGDETYTISQGEHEGPIISKARFNPLDVKQGETLEITVEASDVAPVVSMKALLKSDSASQSFALKKIDEQGTKSIWQGTIIPESTLWYTYILTITATSDRGTSTATIAPRS